jgi:hypothetical protein
MMRWGKRKKRFSRGRTFREEKGARNWLYRIFEIIPDCLIVNRDVMQNAAPLLMSVACNTSRVLLISIKKGEDLHK